MSCCDSKGMAFCFSSFAMKLRKYQTTTKHFLLPTIDSNYVMMVLGDNKAEC